MSDRRGAHTDARDAAVDDSSDDGLPDAPASREPTAEASDAHVASARDIAASVEHCPRCGEPMVSVTSVGPHEHYAVPCGCRTSGLE